MLVDDGSVDGSAALCSKWCSVDSKKRRFVRKTNGGASSARNVGLDAATGDYVLFWDSDDEQDPKAIEKMVRGLPSANGVAVCAIRRVLPDGSWCDILPANIALWSLMRLSASGSGGLYGSLLEACAKVIAHR